MLLSIITANILLAEAMVAVVLSVNWRLSWWLWHVLMVLAFGYVAYSAYVGYRREGATTGLFDGVRPTRPSARSARSTRRRWRRWSARCGGRRRGRSPRTRWSLITAGMESRFGLTEGQTAVLGRAADALRAEREQIGRLDALVAIGHESRVRLDEQDLLRRAVRRVADGFGGDGVRVGLLGGGHLRFPDELATDPTLAGRRRPDPARWRSPSTDRGGMEPGDRSTEAILACPLTVKDKPAGVLLTRRHERVLRARPVAVRLAGQPALDGHGERAALPPARRAVPAYMSPGRRHRPARRPRAGGARWRGRRGDGAVRGPARVHRLLRAVHARRRSW